MPRWIKMNKSFSFAGEIPWSLNALLSSVRYFFMMFHKASGPQWKKTLKILIVVGMLRRCFISFESLHRKASPLESVKNESEISRMKSVQKAIKMFHHCLITRIKIFFFFLLLLCYSIATFSYTFQLNLDLFHSIFSIFSAFLTPTWEEMEKKVGLIKMKLFFVAFISDIEGYLR